MPGPRRVPLDFVKPLTVPAKQAEYGTFERSEFFAFEFIEYSVNVEVVLIGLR